MGWVTPLESALRWPVGKTDLTYAFDSNFPDSFVQLVVSDFDEWASGSGYFTFSRVADIGTSDLKISFQKMNHGDGADFDGPLGTLAHARLHFDVDETWSLGPGPVPNVIDFKSVALHEIGHLIGLNHSQYQDAVMWESLPLGTVSKKNNVNTSGNKKKDAEPTKEIERVSIDGKYTLVDNEGETLEKANSSGDHDSKDEVESVDNEMISFLASKKDIPDNIQSICNNLDIKV
ncbi:metallopeptidase, catalytic domain-containing protein [Tanacetum coccineum]